MEKERGHERRSWLALGLGKSTEGLRVRGEWRNCICCSRVIAAISQFSSGTVDSLSVPVRV